MNILDALYLLQKNETIQDNTINMVPSENNMSLVSRLPLLLDINNRYFFNDTGDSKLWNFRGAQDIYQMETEVAIPLLKKFAKSKYVNVRPVSGLSGMALILNSLGGGPGSNILTVSPEQGGHYATKNLAESFGLNVDFLQGIDEHTFNFEQIEKQVCSKKISLIYVDQSHCLFPLDIYKLSQSVKKVSPDTLIHVDSSHFLGLIFGNALTNPLMEGADSFGGSTHKTFPGPQRAVVCTNNEAIASKVKDAQFYMISSHHFGTIASLAISLLEFERSGEQYAKQVLKNALELAKNLDNNGYDVKGKKYGFTKGHQIWMSTSNCGIDSYISSERLFRCGIRTNVLNDLPNTKELTLRIGVNEITKYGAKEEEIKELSSIIINAISEDQPVHILKERVKELKNAITPFYGFNQDQQIMEKVFELMKSFF